MCVPGAHNRFGGGTYLSARVDGGWVVPEVVWGPMVRVREG